MEASTSSSAPSADEGLWTFPAVPRAVSEARLAVARLAHAHKAAQETKDAIALCVSEAVANVVVHAYRESSEDGQVELEAVRVTDGLCIYVRDSGTGLRPRSNGTGHGFGLPLMAQLADAFEVRPSPSGGTEVVLHFAFAQEH